MSRWVHLNTNGVISGESDAVEETTIDFDTVIGAQRQFVGLEHLGGVRYATRLLLMGSHTVQWNHEWSLYWRVDLLLRLWKCW